MAVHPQIGVTETICNYPGATLLFASAGEGGPLVLNNSANLTPGFLGDTRAALHVHAQAFHIVEHFVYRTGLVWNGFEYVVGPLLVKESLWSLEYANEQNADYKSQDIVINNSGDITTTNSNLWPIIAEGTMKSVTVINSGDLTSAGDGKSGIYAKSGVGEAEFTSPFVRSEFQFPGGPVLVDNSGAIRMVGFANNAIRALSVGGGLTTKNSGDIAIDGENGSALRAKALTGFIDITNSGALTLNGAGAEGISAEMTYPGEVKVTNDGAMTITGAPWWLRSRVCGVWCPAVRITAERWTDPSAIRICCSPSRSGPTAP